MNADTSWLARAGVDHGANEVVIVLAFVGEAASIRGDRDDAGLGPVDQMEKPAEAAVRC